MTGCGTVVMPGNVVRSECTFRPVVGTVALGDVRAEAVDPEGTATELLPAALGVNVFETYATIPEGAVLGTWLIRWESRGPSPVITAKRTFQVA